MGVVWITGGPSSLFEKQQAWLWVLFPARRCCISAVWTIKVCMVMRPFSFENCGIFFLWVQILILRSICCCLPACCYLFVVCFCSFDVLAVAAVVVGIGSLVIVQKVTRNCWDKREKLESMIISVKCKKTKHSVSQREILTLNDVIISRGVFLILGV